MRTTQEKQGLHEASQEPRMPPRKKRRKTFASDDVFLNAHPVEDRSASTGGYRGRSKKPVWIKEIVKAGIAKGKTKNKLNDPVVEVRKRLDSPEDGYWDSDGHWVDLSPLTKRNSFEKTQTREDQVAAHYLLAFQQQTVEDDNRSMASLLRDTEVNSPEVSLFSHPNPIDISVRSHSNASRTRAGPHTVRRSEQEPLFSTPPPDLDNSFGPEDCAFRYDIPIAGRPHSLSQFMRHVKTRHQSPVQPNPLPAVLRYDAAYNSQGRHTNPSNYAEHTHILYDHDKDVDSSNLPDMVPLPHYPPQVSQSVPQTSRRVLGELPLSPETNLAHGQYPSSPIREKTYSKRIKHSYRFPGGSHLYGQGFPEGLNRPSSNRPRSKRKGSTSYWPPQPTICSQDLLPLDQVNPEDIEAVRKIARGRGNRHRFSRNGQQPSLHKFLHQHPTPLPHELFNSQSQQSPRRPDPAHLFPVTSVFNGHDYQVDIDNNGLGDNCDPESERPREQTRSKKKRTTRCRPANPLFNERDAATLAFTQDSHFELPQGLFNNAHNQPKVKRTKREPRTHGTRRAVPVEKLQEQYLKPITRVSLAQYKADARVGLGYPTNSTFLRSARRANSQEHSHPHRRSAMGQFPSDALRPRIVHASDIPSEAIISYPPSAIPPLLRPRAALPTFHSRRRIARPARNDVPQLQFTASDPPRRVSSQTNMTETESRMTDSGLHSTQRIFRATTTESISAQATGPIPQPIPPPLMPSQLSVEPNNQGQGHQNQYFQKQTIEHDQVTVAPLNEEPRDDTIAFVMENGEEYHITNQELEDFRRQLPLIEPQFPLEIISNNADPLESESVDYDEFLTFDTEHKSSSGLEPPRQIQPVPTGLSGLHMTDYLLKMAELVTEFPSNAETERGEKIPPLPNARQRKLDERRRRVVERRSEKTSLTGHGFTEELPVPLNLPPTTLKKTVDSPNVDYKDTHRRVGLSRSMSTTFVAAKRPSSHNRSSLSQPSRIEPPLYKQFKQPTLLNAIPQPPPSTADRISARLANTFPAFARLLPTPAPPPPPVRLGARTGGPVDVDHGAPFAQFKPPRQRDEIRTGGMPDYDICGLLSEPDENAENPFIRRPKVFVRQC